MGATTNFGQQVTGGLLAQLPPANNKAVCRYQNTTGATVMVDKVWVNWGSAMAGNHFKAVIYSDAGAAPSTLLRTSPESTGHTTGWHLFTISPALEVTAGMYVWAGVIADATDLTGLCFAAGAIYYNSDTYSDGPSATFGSPTIASGYTYPIVLEGDDGQLRFGRSSVDAGSGTYQTDREHGEKFVLGGVDTVSVQSISTYIKTTSATVKCKAAIFADSAGTPGTKIAQTVEETGTTANAWKTLAFTAPVSLAPGTYWLCFITNENVSTPTVPFNTNLMADGLETEASAWTSPSTLRDVIGGQGIDIYATYTIEPPEPPPPSGHGWKPRPWQQGSIGGHSFKRPS